MAIKKGIPPDYVPDKSVFDSKMIDDNAASGTKIIKGQPSTGLVQTPDPINHND